MKVLIIVGHPRAGSFCDALAAAYAEGARQAGAEVCCLHLADLEFEPDVQTHSPRDQHQEADVLRAQKLLRWADHWVWIFPNWWGAMPARLKGFLDRVLTPGFAFEEREGGGYEPLLRGKSAHLLVTMDTPPWVYRRIMKQPGVQALKVATLQFCGVHPVRVSLFGIMKDATEQQRQRWLQRAQNEGEKLHAGILSSREKLQAKIISWLRAMRLQFYPMAWVAYSVGALAAARQRDGLQRDAYWLGFGFLFLLEVATVFLNDYYDIETDRSNRHYGPFSGGSRVLVEERLSFGEMRAGTIVVLALCAACALGVLLTAPASSVSLAVIMAAATALALGYTAPPLKLAYRLPPELDVCLTHSFLLVLCGWVFQGQSWHDAFPWLVSVPLFLASFPAITLAAVPDCEADAAAGKSTLAVRFGTEKAMQCAAILALVAALFALLWQVSGIAGGLFAGAGYWILPHALLLVWMIQRHLRDGKTRGRINALIAVALAYILPFGVVPLWHLWRG